MPLYADIVLPLAQPAYTFAVPEGMHVAEGTAVAVQFGPRNAISSKAFCAIVLTPGA